MTQTSIAGLRVWLKRIGLFVIALLVLALVAVIVFQKFADGPYGMLQGGPFQSGEIIDARNVDYSAMAGDSTELLLVGPGTSRTLGYFMHDDQVYISCDLGFMWNRFSGIQKAILNIIYVFKTWHQDAIEDGRAELRIAGNRYPGYLHLVEDQNVIAELKSQLEDLAREWIAPEVLGPVPEAPNDILFFRFEPKATSAQKSSSL